MLRNGKLALIAVALAFTASACRKKPAPAPTPIPSTSAADRERIRLDSIRAAEEARQAADRAREQNMGAQQQSQSTRSVQTTMAAPIYFELDDADVTPEAVGVLEAKVAIMLRETSMRIRVTGHTDDRGSDEYNVALGMRRAAETKRFLVDRGIAGSRIDIATRGEEEPAVRGQDETAWSRNRRAEFVIISR